MPEPAEAGGVAEGFVAVERDAVVATQALQHLGDAGEAFHVGFYLAAELELEVVQAVALDGGLERGGQAVLRIGAGVALHQAVGQADGVAQHDLCGAHEFEPRAPGVAQHARAKTFHPRVPGGTQGGVGHRLVEQGGAELRGQARQAARDGDGNGRFARLLR